MNTKVKKRKIKILVLICIFLILILFIIAKYVKINNNESKTREEIIEEQVQSYLSDKICPQNMSTLYGNYKGKNSKNDLYRNLKVFVDGLPNFIEDIKQKDDNELINYFYENKEKIYTYIGINEEKEFLNLSKYLQTQSINDNQFEYCKIDDSTYKLDDEEKYLTFNIKFIYKNTDNTINLKICFANSNETMPRVKYTVID